MKRLSDLILVLLFVSMIIAISYFIYAYIPKEKNITYNNFPDCLHIDKEKVKVVLKNMSASPLSDSKAVSFSGNNYDVTLKNTCEKDMNISILLSVYNESSMPLKAVKFGYQNETNDYSSYFLSDMQTEKLDIKMQSLSYKKKGYQLLNTNIPKNEEKKISLKFWIDENEGGLGKNSTSDDFFKAQLFYINK